MKKTIKATVLGAVLLAATAVPALAAPPVGQVGLHQHYINTPHGQVAIAEQFCDGEKSVAFDNLHNNVHIAAPGLDSSPAVSMTATGCP